MAIETGFPCIPTTFKGEEVGRGGGAHIREGRLFDYGPEGVGTYSGEGAYQSVGACLTMA